MLKEGIFKKYKPDVAFGLHITSKLNVGQLGYRSGPAMASADRFEITVKGVQTHGSTPWAGADPIAAAAQIVTGVNHIVSRQINITKEPAIVSFGKIAGGVRNNIIPEEVEMVGTIRNFDMDNRQQIFEKIKTTAEHIAMSSGNTAHVTIYEGYPVTVNDPKLTKKMLPALEKVTGKGNLIEMPRDYWGGRFLFLCNGSTGIICIFWAVRQKELILKMHLAITRHTFTQMSHRLN